MGSIESSSELICEWRRVLGRLKHDVKSKMEKEDSWKACNRHIKLNENDKTDKYGVPKKIKDDIVWQQMSLAAFYSLLVTNCLYFKPLVKFSEADERKLSFYLEMYVNECTDAKKKEAIKDTVEQFEKRLFISCWYHADQLSDIVFKEYAQFSSGVAIGVKVGKLLGALRNNACKDCGPFRYREYIPGKDILNSEEKIPGVGGDSSKLYYDDVVYLPDYERKIAYPYDMLTPAFSKSQNHNDDREFRLCFVDSEKSVFSGDDCHSRRHPPRFLNTGRVLDIIERIAVRVGDLRSLYLVKNMWEIARRQNLGSVLTLDTDHFNKEVQRMIETKSSDKNTVDGFATIRFVRK